MKVLAVLTALVLVLVLGTVLAAAKPAPPSPLAAPAAARPVPAAAPQTAPADPAAPARAEAVDLLGAAGSAQQAGDLGIAWELARQAVAKWPEYAEAQIFLKEVEAQQKRAEDAAAAQAYAARNNGWSQDEERHLVRAFYDPPRTGGLAAACAAQNVRLTIRYTDWLRWIDAKDGRVQAQVTDILRRCQADPLDIPIRG